MVYAKAFAKTCQKFLSSDGCSEIKSKSKNETFIISKRKKVFILV